MNVQVEVKGLNKVDFALPPYGWVRDLKVEFCGVDDEDTCEEALMNFFTALQPVPFENVRTEHLEGASKELYEALSLYIATLEEVIHEDTISIVIRPVPKSSRDSTAEETAEFIAKMEGQA